jgi:hypothetical protein
VTGVAGTMIKAQKTIDEIFFLIGNGLFEWLKHKLSTAILTPMILLPGGINTIHDDSI